MNESVVKMSDEEPADRPLNKLAFVSLVVSVTPAVFYSAGILAIIRRSLGVASFKHQMESDFGMAVLALLIPAMLVLLFDVYVVRRCWLMRFQRRDFGLSVVAVVLASIWSTLAAFWSALIIFQ